MKKIKGIKEIKGSFTIEAAVIVPIFAMVIVQMILLAMNCHDIAMRNIVATKVTLRMEFEGVIHGIADKNVEESLLLAGNEVLAVKSIGKTAEITINKTLLDVKSQYSKAVINNPVDFVRLTDAIKKIANRKKG